MTLPMASGWVDYTAENEIYYCGTELEGYAYTGWQVLEPKEDIAGGDYDDLENFHFKDSGKMHKDTTWYDKGWYYTFDENGVLEDDWYDIEIATNTLGVATGAKTNGAFTTYVGTKGTGWVYTEDPAENDYYWYYLIAVKDVNGTIRNVPFNSQSGDGLMRAKVIKGKTYLFDTAGKMKTGVVHVEDSGDNATLTPNNQLTDANNKKLDDYKGGAIAKVLEPGYYYFNDGARNVKGQMLTGKQAYTTDGETFYYYFDKSTGKALVNEVKDGVVYSGNGRRLQAEDGNANEIFELQSTIKYSKGKELTAADGTKFHGIPAGSKVIISSTGKLRTSGIVRVDGVKYKITVLDDGKWDLVEQPD